MILAEPLERAILIKRYKRFLADVQLESGETIVVHCPNPGSMIGCAEPGSFVLLRPSRNPKAKLPYTWVMTLSGQIYISVDTLLANKLMAEALKDGTVAELKQYPNFSPEYTYGDSRFDFCLRDSEMEPQCLVEVKSTTMALEDIAMFPDAKTERGRKHLHGLARACEEGLRAVQFFCVSRGDTKKFEPADQIDPLYAKALRESVARGVEVLAYSIKVVELEPGKLSVELDSRLEVQL